MIILLTLLISISLNSPLYAIERAPYSLGEAKEGEGNIYSETPTTPSLACAPQEEASKPIPPIPLPRGLGEACSSSREQASVHPGVGLWGIKGEQ